MSSIPTGHTRREVPDLVSGTPLVEKFLLPGLALSQSGPLSTSGLFPLRPTLEPEGSQVDLPPAPPQDLATRDSRSGPSRKGLDEKQRKAQ